MTIGMQLADFIIEQPHALENGALELSHFEIPAMNAGNIFLHFLLIHQSGVAGQLPQRPGNKDGRQPDTGKSKQYQRHALHKDRSNVTIQSFEGRRPGALGDDPPAGFPDGSKARQHINTLGIHRGERIFRPSDYLINGDIIRYLLPYTLFVRMIDQRFITVDHINIGTIMVVMGAQDTVQYVFFLQINGTGDIAEIATIVCHDRVRNADKVIASRGNEGVGNKRFLGFK